MPTKRYLEILTLLALLLAAAGLGVLWVDWQADHSFITYRYAQHLAAGGGFAYNVGHPVLSEAVAPLYVLLLAVAAGFTPDLPLVSNVAGIVAIALGALALYLIARPAGWPVAAAAAAFYLLSPLLWTTLGTETALWMALGLWAIWAHGREWGNTAAVLLACATLMRPEAAILAFALAADGVLNGRPLRLLPGGLYAGIVALGLLGIARSVEGGALLPAPPQAIGGLLPPEAIGGDMLVGAARLGVALLAFSPLWAIVLPVAVCGAASLRGARWALPLLGWAGMHLATLVMLRAAACVWHFAPLLPALGALIGLGLHWIAAQVKPRQMQRALNALLALLIAGAAAHTFYIMEAAPSYASSRGEALLPAPVEEGHIQAALWLRDNTPPDALVGATQIGVLGYLSQRPLLDYYGRLQPEVRQALVRGDRLWWLDEYQPSYLVLRSSERDALAALSAQGDLWLSRAYAEVARFPSAADAVVVLARIVDPPPLVEQLVGMVRYDNGIVLNSIATDFPLAPLEGGRMGRVRLEWLLEEPVEAPRYVALAIRGREGTVAALGGQVLDFQRWPTRRLITTFHTLDLAPALPPGVYDVQVGIGADALNLTWQTVAIAKIPFAEAAFVGAVAGLRAEFGDLTLLGYRLSSGAEGLEVLLLWEAVRAPHADYRVLVQVRDAQGVVVAHTEAEPYDGAYPTSVWSAGERVTDVRHLETGNLAAGEYTVYVGLIDPDGRRLLTPQGQDAVLLGQITIGG